MSALFNNHYFKSNCVKVFPCAYRGQKSQTNTSTEQEIINPEARVQSEFNLSNSSIAYPYKKSYLISYSKNTVGGSTYTLKCVIGGYYFEILNLDSNELTNKYLSIRLVNCTIGSDSTVDVTPVLAPCTDTADITGTLDLLDTTQDIQYFVGIYVDSVEKYNYSLKPVLADNQENNVEKLPKVLSGSGINSILMASAISANGNNAIAIGEGLKADYNNQVVLGKYNLNTSGNLFEFGNGENNSSRKNLVSITAGNTTFNTDLTANNIKATSNLETDGNITDKGNLSVTGTTTLNDKLTVSKNGAVINGNVTLNNDLDVTGATTLNNKLTVNNQGIDITGDSSFHNNLIVDGDATLKSKITVIGDSNLKGKLDVTGNLDVTGEAAFTSGIKTDTIKAKTSNDTTINNNTTIIGDLNIKNGTNIKTTLDNNGNIIYSGAISNGRADTAPGTQSIAIGPDTRATGAQSIAIGSTAYAQHDNAMAIGVYVSSSANNQVIIGKYNDGKSNTLFEIGNGTAPVAGYRSNAFEVYSNGAVAEGQATVASGDYSHAEGKLTKALVTGAHAEGESTIIGHMENNVLVSGGEYAHAEGWVTKAYGNYSHTEGYATVAGNETSKTDGAYAHTEGSYTKATGNASHAEGSHSEATGDYAHAEGSYTKATEEGSHAEGSYTIASNKYSHAAGFHTKTGRSYQSVLGYYNNGKDSTLLEVGNGNSDTSRHNILDISTNGTIFYNQMALPNVIAMDGRVAFYNSGEAITYLDQKGLGKVSFHIETSRASGYDVIILKLHEISLNVVHTADVQGSKSLMDIQCLLPITILSNILNLPEATIRSYWNDSDIQVALNNSSKYLVKFDRTTTGSVCDRYVGYATSVFSGDTPSSGATGVNLYTNTTISTTGNYIVFHIRYHLNSFFNRTSQIDGNPNDAIVFELMCGDTIIY